jgi:GNAT superfamily N-acetyltransferase
MATSIRSATAADVPTIARLIRELAAFEKLSDQAVLRDEDLAAHLFGPRRHAEVLLAESDGEVVGFALFFHTFSTFLAKPGLYLEDLFVVPERRGRGHGEALLRHLAGIAVDRGCGRFEWSVLDWNRDAIRFYERIGAVPIEGWTQYRVTGDALIGLAAKNR